ncbi:MAG: hypothetical protein R3E93_01830 [Thiothrix sp.]
MAERGLTVDDLMELAYREALTTITLKSLPSFWSTVTGWLHSMAEQDVVLSF